MYSDLPRDLQVEILRWLNPCEQVAILCINTQFRSIIETQDNYVNIARNYGLPLALGNTPLKHLCMFYRTINDRCAIRYRYLIIAAIETGDDEWMESYGMDLFLFPDDCELCQIVVDWAVRKGHLERIDGSLLDFAVTSCLTRGDLQSLLALSEKYGDECEPYDTNLLWSAIRGHEDMINHFGVENDDIRRDVLRGYVLGGHLGLYEKYSRVYGLEACFNKYSMRTAIDLGNVEVLKMLIDKGMIDECLRADSITRTPLHKTEEIFEIVRQISRDNRISPYRLILKATRGNYVILDKFRYLIKSRKLCVLRDRSEWSLISSAIEHLSETIMINRYQDFKRSLDILLDINGNLFGYKQILLERAIEIGNLELIEILQ